MDSVSERNQIGEVVADYGVAESRIRRSVFVGTPVMLLLGGMLLYLGYARPPERERNTKAIVVGIVSVIGGLYIPLHALWNRNRRLLIGTQGLAYTDGAAITVFPWRDIDFLWEKTNHHSHGSAIRLHVVLTLERNDRVRIKLDNYYFPNLDEIAGHIKREMLQWAWPDLLSSYQGGLDLSFGPLTFHRDGLRKKHDLVSWIDVRDVKVEEGKLIIIRGNKSLTWFKAPIGEIPNLHILLALVQHARGEDWDEGLSKPR